MLFSSFFIIRTYTNQPSIMSKLQLQRLLFNIENSYPGFLSNTIEKKTGVDLNHDGYVGGERNAEKQFGVDLNNDGYIGGEGEYLGYFSTLISNIITYH